MYKIDNAASPTPEIYLYGDIGESWFGDGIRAERVIKDIAALGKKKDIAVRIDSAGGSVWEGLNIYNALVRNPATITVHVDALAASIASVIAMAGNRILIADNAMMMVHEPAGSVLGTAADMRKQADLLDQVRGNLVAIYAGRATLPEPKVSSLMQAETWMNATEALQLGMVSEITPSLAMAASARSAAPLARYGYRNVPAYLLSARETPRLQAYRSKASRLFRLADVPAST
jgi:ATP-dependent protease ClpP protease subunit